MDLKIKKGKLNFLWKILLSATLFNLAFFFSNFFGWIIIVALIFLFLLQKKMVYVKITHFFLLGFLWGLVTFALHFIWLYELLLTKSQADKFLSSAVFVFCVFYFSIFSGLWFLVTKIIFNFSCRFYISFLFSIIIFFWFIEEYSFFIFGRAEGYPFLNPILPLAKYKIFLFFYSFIFLNFLPRHELKDTKILYLKPVQGAGELSSVVVGQMIYQKLATLNLNKYSVKYKNLIIVAPETSFPFALNRHMEMIDFWNNTLPKNAHFLLGSQREEKGKLLQTLYHINLCRIINFYDKTHKVPFTEKIPKKWKKFNFSKQLFLDGKEEFHKGNIPTKFFNISKDLIILPKICSEIFFKTVHIPQYNSYEKSRKINNDKKPLFPPSLWNNFQIKIWRKKLQQKDIFIFIFVNDSWFMNYLKQIMENYIRLKQRQLGIPILYITHSKMLNLGFFPSNL